MEDDDLYAMYGNHEDEPKVSKTIMRHLENKSAKTRRINVGIVGYDVPTVEHVAALEKKIDTLEQHAAQQDSKIRRMESLIAKLRSEMIKFNGSVSTMTREIDQKIGRNDY